jgi:hypothetical protein
MEIIKKCDLDSQFNNMDAIVIRRIESKNPSDSSTLKMTTQVMAEEIRK